MSGTAPIRLGVLSMDELPEPAQPILGDYPELYAHLLRDQPVDLVHFAAHRGELPASVDECDGWLLGGSRRSVSEEIGWIRDAEHFVRAAHAAERPTIGICFGHQLIASALGGAVQAADVGWGLGALDYRVVHAAGRVEGDRITLVASHRDQVTCTPAGAEVWAAADYCPIAGMTIGDHVWTVQGHPEFTAELAARLYAARADAVGRPTVDRALATLTRPLSNSVIAGVIAGVVGRRR